MRILLAILVLIFNPIITDKGIQIGEIKTNNQTIKIMKMNLNNPAFLQGAGNAQAKEYISFVDASGNPEIFQLSAIGDVTIQSIYNGEPISQTVTNPTDTGIQIQSDANTEVVLYGKITKLYCDPGPGSFTNFTNIDVAHAKSLTFLSCVGNQLTSLDVSTNTALTSLSCSSNQLTSLDVSTNTALTSLSCSGNQLTSLDVSTNTALTSLSCGGNQLTSLDVSTNTALTSLDCVGNQLTSLDVSTNTALTSLSCSGNQLTSLDVSTNTALTYLDCVGNQLTSLDVSTNTALTYLSCVGNQLTSLDVSTNTALTSLSCGSNQLTSLDVSTNTALTYLDCVGNQLTSLDVSTNTALTYLSCGENSTLLTIDGIGVNEDVATSIAGAITEATSVDGTVTLRQGDEFNQTIIDAAMDKGWDVQYYQ